MLIKIIFRRATMVLAGMICCAFLLVTCMNDETVHTQPAEANKLNYEQFAGSQACAGCHKSIFDSHTHTAHYLTSQPASEQSIKGSFEAGKNTFAFNPAAWVAMEKRDSRLYQVEYVNGVEKIAKSVDIVIGSGKRGQTFLSWENNKLFQLPITYFTSAHQWSNSPGYSNKVNFNRPITSRCLECHSTYFDKIPASGNGQEAFSTSNIIYGVSCERCHGPGAAHVQFQTQHPDEKKARYIITTAAFTRAQKLDMCRLCHGGRLAKTKPSFQFESGDTLSHFFVTDTLAKDVTNIDAHGNQYGMLTASKCFKMSSMTCGTCHSPHNNETGNTALFSQRCMNCHSAASNNYCKMAGKAGMENIKKDCISCHMPEQSSRAIMVLLQGQDIPTPALMRSHFIAVYPVAAAPAPK